ncbi:hypothetical protein B0H12DRAFT_1233457 [Mycena haematopus]|nr:hypothetical protein B0H12DRAFT_1233457 [Mycena haematopus]
MQGCPKLTSNPLSLLPRVPLRLCHRAVPLALNSDPRSSAVRVRGAGVQDTMGTRLGYETRPNICILEPRTSSIRSLVNRPARFAASRLVVLRPPYITALHPTTLCTHDAARSVGDNALIAYRDTIDSAGDDDKPKSGQKQRRRKAKIEFIQDTEWW